MHFFYLHVHGYAYFDYCIASPCSCIIASSQLSNSAFPAKCRLYSYIGQPRPSFVLRSQILNFSICCVWAVPVALISVKLSNRNSLILSPQKILYKWSIIFRLCQLAFIYLSYFLFERIEENIFMMNELKYNDDCEGMMMVSLCLMGKGSRRKGEPSGTLRFGDSPECECLIGSRFDV